MSASRTPHRGSEPRVVRSTHGWRKLPYTVIQLGTAALYTKHGLEGPFIHIPKAYSAIGALRQTRLIPGAKVKVWVSAIVHARRVRAARKLYKGI